MAKHAIYFYLVLFVYLFSVPQRTLCLENFRTAYIVTGAGVLIATVIYNWHGTFVWKEYCSQSWRNFNASALDNRFKQHLFGQHLVSSTVSKFIRAHVFTPEPHKALVMSFHGWTGCGKTYVANMITEILYEKGPKSEFVHWYVASRDFPYASQVQKYQGRLRQEIQFYTKKCSQSLFIFDEMDKLTPGVIDAISTFIDFDDTIKEINYRKNIFIFIGNTGGKEITKIAFNFWLDGKDREDVTMRDVEPLLLHSALYEKGGLQNSKIVKKNLIDVFVPFLPLEKSHIKDCIVRELQMRERKVSQRIVNKVANQIIYYPLQFQSFSVSGCKKISHKIDIFGKEK